MISIFFFAGQTFPTHSFIHPSTSHLYYMQSASHRKNPITSPQ